MSEQKSNDCVSFGKRRMFDSEDVESTISKPGSPSTGSSKDPRPVGSTSKANCGLHQPLCRANGWG
eukprot:6356713-Alexandrium_andersonii.AAC.1